MPLEHSSTPSAFKHNVETLMGEVGKSPHVKSRAQALAIAYSTMNRAKHRDAGGATNTDAVQAIINALQAGSNTSGANASNPMGNSTATTMAASPTTQTSQAGLVTPTQTNAATTAATNTSGLQTLTNALSGLNTSAATTNTAHMAAGGVPWFVKQEARQMQHTGPVLSAVPGRTDRHNISVPSGSYVLPAETVSHLGQSNSVAGLKIANRMFGQGGPYGMAHLLPGASPARPQGLKSLTDTGGARGEGSGEPVPVIVAGGEYIIHPAVVAAIGGGNVKRGHAILDKWVMSMRKDHLKTLRKLKPPVKS